jgi:hypothetical protein
MKDFAVRRLGENGAEEWRLYIGFTEKPSESGGLINCYGCALVQHDGKKKWFNYLFGHSADWNIVTELIVTPVRKQPVKPEVLCEVGTQIVNSIRDFIIRGN